MFRNVYPEAKRQIEWGWVRRYSTAAGWMVKEPLGFIRMPDLDKYFNWDKIIIEAPPERESYWRGDEGLTLGTRNMKSIFTTAARFLGYEKLLLELPDLGEIAQGFLEWNDKLLNLFGSKMEYFMIGDDYASSNGLMLSPKLLEDWILPYLAEMVELAKFHGLSVIFHSDGDIYEMLPMLGGLEIDFVNFERVGKMARFEDGDIVEGIELWENNPGLKNENLLG